MAVRRLIAVGLWLCVTALATAIVWAGTSTVAADLTDRPAPVVAHSDVVTALQSDSSAVETSPGITAPGTNSSASTVPSDRGRSALGAPVAPVPQPPGAQSPVPGVATTNAPRAAPAPPPAGGTGNPPTPQAPRRPTATYSTAGGVVTVACNGNFFIELVSATPSNGYAVDVVTAGPYFIEVHFVRAGQDQPIWAFCLGQPFRADAAPRGQWPASP